MSIVAFECEKDIVEKIKLNMNNKSFGELFCEACDEFKFVMGNAVPDWFIQYLKETRSKIIPKSKNNSIKIAGWEGHSFEEIEVYLHALHISSAGMKFNILLSQKTGFIMAHQCGCGDCFYPGEIKVGFGTFDFVADFQKHVTEQKKHFLAA